MTNEKMRQEFTILVERCGCSQAYDGKCHPKRCFPQLYQLLYPKRGFSMRSHLVKRYIVRMEILTKK